MVQHTVLRLRPGGRNWSQSEEPGVGRGQSVARPATASAAAELTPPPQVYAHSVPLPVYRGRRAGLGDKLKKRSGEAEAHVQMGGVSPV